MHGRDWVPLCEAFLAGAVGTEAFCASLCVAEALRLHAVTLLGFLELFLAVLDPANSPLGAVSLATEIFFKKEAQGFGRQTPK